MAVLALQPSNDCIQAFKKSHFHIISLEEVWLMSFELNWWPLMPDFERPFRVAKKGAHLQFICWDDLFIYLNLDNFRSSKHVPADMH